MVSRGAHACALMSPCWIVNGLQARGGGGYGAVSNMATTCHLGGAWLLGGVGGVCADEFLSNGLWPPRWLRWQRRVDVAVAAKCRPGGTWCWRHRRRVACRRSWSSSSSSIQQTGPRGPTWTGHLAPRLALARPWRKASWHMDTATAMCCTERHGSDDNLRCGKGLPLPLGHGITHTHTLLPAAQGRRPAAHGAAAPHHPECQVMGPGGGARKGLFNTGHAWRWTGFFTPGTQQSRCWAQIPTEAAR